jgi:SM-20-related protein
VSAAAELRLEGISIRDEFIDAPRIRALLDCLGERRARGEFGAARVGNPSHLERRESIRGDFTCWIEEPLFSAERTLLDDLEGLRQGLNREFFLGLLELELHYAVYPPGAGYSRHLDQPQGRTQRKLSMVLYLNVDWQPEAGGALRVFDGAAGYRDIDPIGGRLVCFMTADREHEVLPAHRERVSISGWFRARD